MRFLENFLHISVRPLEYPQASFLPYYLRDSYDFQLFMLDKTQALFLYPTGTLPPLPMLKKQLSRIVKDDPMPVVLALNAIDHSTMRALIRNAIPFVVHDKQIYLPFMGIWLQEKLTLRGAPQKKLSPSAQMVLLFIIYSNSRFPLQSEIAHQLGISTMSVSRSLSSLEELDLISCWTNGLHKCIALKESPKALFNRALPYLRNPVKKRIYVSRYHIQPDWVPAGLSALARRSMLNPPALESYATSHIPPDLEHGSSSRLIDPFAQVELEVWSYPPDILSRFSHTIDPLSLMLSLKHEKDERIQKEITHMLNDFWENQYGTWN